MMKFKNIILFIVFSLFVSQPANVLHADDAVTKILGKAQELAEKQKIKGKSLSEFITNNVITVDYEDEERAYKFNIDITYEVYVGGKIVEQGTWAIKGLTKNSIKLTGHQDLYIQIYKDKERISTLTNLQKKDDSQTNRKILKISSSSDFEKQLAQIELEKQKALEQKKKEEEEKRLAEEKKRQEEEEKRIAEEEKKKAEIQKIASSKIKKLDDYSKSNEQLLKKAEQISSLLLELKNDREGEKLIDEYNLALEDQYSQAIAEAAEVPYAETPIVETIHLSLKNYVAKGEGKIKIYQAELEKAEKKEKAEKEKQKRLAEKAEKKSIAEEERLKKEKIKKEIEALDLKKTRELTEKALKKVQEEKKKKKEESDKFSEFEGQSQRLNLTCMFNMPVKIITNDYGYDGKVFYLDNRPVEIGTGTDIGGIVYELSQKGKKPIFLIDIEQRLPSGGLLMSMKTFVDFTKKSSSLKMHLPQTGMRVERQGRCYVP